MIEEKVNELFSLDDYNSIENVNIHRAVSYLYEILDGKMLCTGKFDEVNEIYRTVNIDKMSVQCIVSMTSIATRWLNYLDYNIIKDFYFRGKNKIADIEPKDVDRIYEGWDKYYVK